ncbi:MAG TPA: macro domain-containing protein [Patescibacteria group bacterium]|nr:macro domain-containing protein [Patescibacteria group bacterium]
MPKIILGSGSISRFTGDAVVVPSDTDLTYKKSNRILQYLAYGSDTDYSYKKISKEEREKRKECEVHLLKELSGIGHIELGHAVITKSYGLPVTNLIFLPYEDHDSPDEILDSVTLHQATRAAFTLATLYNVKTIAIPIIKKHFRKKDMINDFITRIFNKEALKILSEDEIMNIMIGVSREYNNTSLEEITLYR